MLREEQHVPETNPDDLDEDQKWPPARAPGSSGYLLMRWIQSAKKKPLLPTPVIVATFLQLHHRLA